MSVARKENDVWLIRENLEADAYELCGIADHVKQYIDDVAEYAEYQRLKEKFGIVDK